MVRLEIAKTWKSYSPRAVWSRYENEAHNFETMADAKAWVKENVPPGRRAPMYVDTRSRGTIKCGYIVGFRVNDYDAHGNRVKHLEQWWISFSEIVRHPSEGKQGELRSIAL